MSLHVAVLMGGRSAEREVSLVSGEACAAALEQKGYRVSRIDAGEDLCEQLLRLKPERVFNALHGRYGEDGRVQGLLDLLAIPYTHSGVLASALAMDKPMAIRVFRSAGIPCPQGEVMSLADLLERGAPIDPPLVVKPAAEGSSVGVFILEDGDLRVIRDRNDLDPDQRVMVEPFIPGRELTCAVLDGKAMAVTEIAPREGFYDYRAKYTSGFADHLIPAPVPDYIYEEVMKFSEVAHNILRCRGISRADFRYNQEAQRGTDLYLLEVNTQPGMTPLSLVPEQAAYRGIAFADLVEHLVRIARCDR